MRMSELSRLCVDIAHAFRLANEPGGQTRLPMALSGIEEAIHRGFLDPAATMPVLQTMLEAQERGDLLLVADVLEHVVAPSLSDL